MLRSSVADRTAGRPILAVDVDGVVSLFGFEEAPSAERVRFEMIDGRLHCVSLAAGRLLRRLGEAYDLVWATGWEGRANDLASLLSLPELPYLTFGGAARFGSAHWKLEPLERYASGRALAWIDDSFDESCYQWARERAEPTLLVPIESATGLEDVQAEALLAWARETG